MRHASLFSVLKGHSTSTSEIVPSVCLFMTSMEREEAMSARQCVRMRRDCESEQSCQVAHRAHREAPVVDMGVGFVYRGDEP